MKKSELKQKIEEALEISEVLALVKPLYARFDAITLDFIAAGISNQVVDGYKINIIDNYADRNTTFKVASFKHYDLKIEKMFATLRDMQTTVRKKTAKKVRKAVKDKPTIDPFRVRKNRSDK